MAETAMTQHDAYYWNLKRDIEDEIRDAFKTSGVLVSDVIGKTAIETGEDMQRLLAFAMKHGDYEGKATMICYATEWLQAKNELMENKKEA